MIQGEKRKDQTLTASINFSETQYMIELASHNIAMLTLDPRGEPSPKTCFLSTLPNPVVQPYSKNSCTKTEGKSCRTLSNCR